MPISLPNGLTIPIKGDNETQSCLFIKELFEAVDGIQSIVGTQGAGETPTNRICQTISSSWTLSASAAGDTTCASYEQTITAPAGIDLSKAVLRFLNASGEEVPLCSRVSGSDLILETNTPGVYTVIYA